MRQPRAPARLRIVKRGAHRLVAADALRLAEGTKALVRELERG